MTHCRVTRQKWVGENVEKTPQWHIDAAMCEASTKIWHLPSSAFFLSFSFPPYKKIASSERTEMYNVHMLFYAYLFSTSVGCGLREMDCRLTQTFWNPPTPTLLEKQSKFPRYNMKCRGKPNTTWTIPHSITFPPLHFMLYRGKSITFGTVDTVELQSDL